jgi:hypothetical protein
MTWVTRSWVTGSAGASGGDQCPPPGPGEEVGRVRLGELGGVRERKDHRTLDVLRHLPHRRLGEGAGDRRGADEHRRPHPADDLGEGDASALALVRPVRHLGGRARVGTLEVAEVGHVVGEQAGTVETPEAAGRLVVRQPLGDHRVADLVGDAATGGAGAEDDDPALDEGDAAAAGAGERGRERGRAGSLHVVVEGADPCAVALEDAPGVARGEVLPVEQHPREAGRRRGDVGVDEGVVALVAHPGMAVADIEGVVEERRVVGAGVEHDRDHPGGVDPGGRGVDGELADRDVDAAHPPVADPEDRLAVGGDDQVDVPAGGAEVREGGRDLVGMVDGEVHAGRPPVLAAVLADRLADRRRVDDREHLVEVVGEQPVVEDLVAVVEELEIDVAGERGRLGPVLRVGAARLLLEGEHRGGKEADEVERVALVVREGHPLVERGVVEDVDAAVGRLPGAVAGQVEAASHRTSSRCADRRGLSINPTG